MYPTYCHDHFYPAYHKCHDHPHFDICVPYDDTALWKAIEESEDAIVEKMLQDGSIALEQRRGYTFGEVDGIRSVVDWAILRNDWLNLNMIKVNPLRYYDANETGGYTEDQFETGIRIKTDTDLFLSDVPSACNPVGGNLFSGSHLEMDSEGNLVNIVLKIKNNQLYLSADPVAYVAQNGDYTWAKGRDSSEIVGPTSGNGGPSVLTYYSWCYVYFNNYSTSMSAASL